MADAPRDLVGLLDLEPIENDIFRGQSPQGRTTRIFGGLVASQALVAAGRTVPSDRHVHSLHAYFLRPGAAGEPVVYLVDRIRDGRSFTTRRVVAVQNGQPIFHLSASFQVLEEGFEHADPMPDVPPPLSLPTAAERYAGVPDANMRFDRPFDLRYVGEPPGMTDYPRPANSAVWLRSIVALPDDPLLHVCALTYASDLTLLDSVSLPHSVSMLGGGITGASLDHAMWFHGPFRADEWLLYAQHSPAASGGRGLATGQIFTEDGRLVASVVQEGLVRKTRPTPTGPPVAPETSERPPAAT